MKTQAMTALVLVSLLSCGHPPDGAPKGHEPELGAPSPLIALAQVSAQPAAAGTPDAPFTGGERAFGEVKDALLHHYAGAAPAEDELLRAAVQGMLEHVDPSRSAWNKLLSPSELAAIHDDLRGEVVGIGAQIHFDDASGYTDVLSVFAGSPAEKAGVLAGDKILSVNGKLFKGKTSKDVLAEIRGKAGETVSLAVLRQDRVLAISAVRGVVAYDVVEHAVFSDIGYVRVRSFNAKTRPAIDLAMDALASAAVKDLVIDLRGNPGGGFDDAIASAQAWLPNGAPIVRLLKTGEPEDVRTSTGTPKLGTLPMAVLVDGETASGGEFVAEALREGRHAQILGTHTFGKWSVQTIDELPNGYAVKYTISELRSGAGAKLDGVGVAPDVEVDADSSVKARAMVETDPTKRLAADVQLRTAVTLLRGR
jgi:carboxyl-terminal processing protease